jgi:hypothetical protein
MNRSVGQHMRCCLTRYDDVKNKGNGPDPMVGTTHALLTAYILTTDKDRSQHPDMTFRQCDRVLFFEMGMYLLGIYHFDYSMIFSVGSTAP